MRKSKFLEIDFERKRAYRKENPSNKKTTVCPICGFLLDVDNVGWYNFIVRCEHLFLRDAYSAVDLE